MALELGHIVCGGNGFEPDRKGDSLGAHKDVVQMALDRMEMGQGWW